MNKPADHPSQTPRAGDMLARVHAEAAELRNFTITFLSLLLYVGLIIASTTHEQILLIAPVRLPLLGVDIPIVGFYRFVPALVFFLHFYILVQHYLFSQLAFRFRRALRREPPNVREDLRRGLGNLPFLHWLIGDQNGAMRLLMTAITVVCLILWPLWTLWWLQAAFLPYHDTTSVWIQRLFVALDAGVLAYLWAKMLDEEDDAGRWWLIDAGWLWWLWWLWWWFSSVSGILMACLAVIRRMATDSRFEWDMPLSRVFVLAVGVVVQMALILYQPTQANWGLRLLGMLCVDVLCIASLETTLSAKKQDKGWKQYKRDLGAIVTRNLFAGFLLLVLLFSFCVSTLPDSAEEIWLAQHLPDAWTDMSLQARNAETWTDMSLQAESANKRRIFNGTFWLHEQQQVFWDEKDYKEYDPARLHACYEVGKPLEQDKEKERDKEKCYWIDSWIPRNLILREWSLIADQELPLKAHLEAHSDATQFATQLYAQPQKLALQGRHLEYADFSASSLPNADLRRAQLHSANFSGAKLEHARLENAELADANLSGAQLPGANLRGAQLPGADLSGAQLPGANLLLAQLPGANLSAAHLPGADLLLAQLPGANLSEAHLPGANLIGAQLPGANLRRAQLPGADLTKAELPGADLREATLSGASLDVIQTDPLPADAARKAHDELARALQDLPRYQSEPGRQALQKKLADFDAAIVKRTTFGGNLNSPACFSDRAGKQAGAPCADKRDAKARQQAYALWRQLACKDDTPQHTIAQRMAERVVYFGNEYQDFAIPLAAALDDPAGCPGLADLDEKLKKAVRKTAARVKSQRPAKPD